MQAFNVGDTCLIWADKANPDNNMKVSKTIRFIMAKFFEFFS